MKSAINIKNCPVCSNKRFKNIFSLNKISEYNLNYQNNIRDALNCKSVSVKFVECINCGFLFNKINKQLNYSVEYETNRSFSKKFDSYLNQIVNYLDTNIFKKNVIKNILEIGSGDDIFLKKISNLDKYNFKNIIGFDPSSKLKLKNKKKNLKIYRKYYTKKNIVKPDLVIIRHTLEHISNVKNFFKLTLYEKPKFLFVEFPCKSFVYTDNIHYYSNEHCSYFDEHSIQVLLNNFGYKKLYIKKVFNGENLLVIFKKSDEKIELFNHQSANTPKINLKKMKKNILKNFNFKYDFFWGAAGKGVMLLNILNVNYNQVPYIVDINENLKGKFIPLCGTQIILPNSLPKYIHKKSKIFIMNSVYKREIEKNISKLKLKNKVYCLFSN